MLSEKFSEFSKKISTLVERKSDIEENKIETKNSSDEVLQQYISRNTELNSELTKKQVCVH